MSTIPSTLAPFLPEYSLDELDIQRAGAVLIERTLQFGDRFEIRWLFTQFSRAEISAWLDRSGREQLPEPHLTFWNAVLKSGV
jgi:hypothetical protein